MGQLLSVHCLSSNESSLSKSGTIRNKRIYNMVKLVTFVLAAVSILLGLTAALPTPDEERYLDKEYARELLNWLTALQAPVPNNQCKYYGNGLSGPMPKRNSELINSLLSLPKNMNDAGK